MRDYKMEKTPNDYKIEKTADIQETTRVMHDHLKEDYSSLYYVFSFVGGMFAALFLYSLSCICRSYCAKSIEI
jgi:hypothetical protein